MKRSQALFSMAIIFCLLFANTSFAVNDPYGLPTYDHVGEGENFNYSHNTINGEGQIVEEGRLGAALSHELSATSVLPGGSVTVTTSASFISGQGDGLDGQDSLKDLLMIVYKDDVILSNVDTASPGSIPGSVDNIQIGSGQSFELTTELTLPDTPGTYTYYYGVFDYGNFSGWMGALIASNSFSITVVQPTYEYKIKPTIYESVGGSFVENPLVGQIKATLDSINGTEVGTLSSGTATFDAVAGTQVYLNALANSGYYFYSWKYNINNGLDIGDGKYRPNPRYVTTPEGDYTFGPAPVFVEKPDLVLTFMQDENPTPETSRRYRVFHKDGSDLLYPLELGYQIAGSSEIVPIINSFSYNHDFDHRFTDQYNFLTNATGINSSETLNLYYKHDGDWVQAQTKASSTLYSITYDPNGGTLEDSSIVYVYAGNSASLAPVPTRDGYLFLGWTYDVEINLENVNQSVIATASWEKIPTEVKMYTVGLSSTDGGSIAPFTGTRQYPGSSILSVTAIADDGYEFVGFSGDVDMLNGSELVVYSNVSLTAVFESINDDLGEDEGTPEENPVDETKENQDVNSDASIEGSEDQKVDNENSNDVDLVNEEILDEETPEELGEALPDTGGVAANLFYSFGTLMAGAGVILKRKKFL